MLESTLAALQVMFTLSGAFFLFAGVVVGLIFGVVPGIGGTTAIALLMPLTLGMDPRNAMMLMGGIMGAVSAGGSITSILINTPGGAPNAATCFDGYPMAQQGKAGAAIGAAAAASTLGGLFGIVLLVAVIPVLKEIVLLFGPPEFFMLALMGLAAVALSTGGQFLRGLIAGGIGLMLSFVGYSGVTGTVRFTGGSEYLWDGISLIPALTGLFAITEMIALSVAGGTISKDATATRVTGVMEGVWACFTHWKTLLQGSAIGTVIGAVPGLGGTVAAFLSYTAAMQISKSPETFGKGNIEGVIGPEAANNSKDGGSLIPTLAFGIPGSAEMAVFLGVLVLIGVEPGPLLLIQNEGRGVQPHHSVIGLLHHRDGDHVTDDTPARDDYACGRTYRGACGHRCLARRGLCLAKQLWRCGDGGAVRHSWLRHDAVRLPAYYAGDRACSGRACRAQLSPVVAHGRWRLDGLFHAGDFVRAIPADRRMPGVAGGADTAPSRPVIEARMTLAVRQREFWAAIVVLALSVGYLLWAKRYPPEAGAVPVLVAWATIILSMIDAVSQFETPLGRWVRRLVTAEKIVEWKMEGDEDAPLTRILLAVAWIAAYLAALFLIGFLIATPIYILSYMLIHGGRSLRDSTLTAAGTTLAIWLTFVVLFRYPLYPGVLFGGY